MINISEKIKAYRARYKLNKSQLGIILGISHVNIVRWESGQCRPTKRNIEMLKENRVI